MRCVRNLPPLDTEQSLGAMTIAGSERSQARWPSIDTAMRRRSRTFKFAVLFLFTVGLFGYAALQACCLPMWSDEITTYWLSQTPSVSALWTAISVGEETNPPLYFMTAQAASQLLGTSAFTLRLPSLLGFWLMCLGLYGFVARRCNISYAWAAMILPTCTIAIRYASEARAYGMWLGLSMGAMFCWQGAALYHRRSLQLVGLTVCLGLTIWTHFYSVLLLVPLGLAELVRTRVKRRVDVGMWVAFALGLSPILGLATLIQRSARLREGFWAQPQWSQIVDTYVWLLTPAVTPLIGALTLILWLVFRNNTAPIGTTSDELGGVAPVPAYELVAVTGFVAMPVITMLLAKLVTNAYHPRYALTTVIGCDLLIILSAAMLTRNRPAVGLVLSLFLGGWFVSVSNPHAEGESNEYRHSNDIAGITRTVEMARLSGMQWIISDCNTYIELLVARTPQDSHQFAFVSGVEEWSGERLIRSYQKWSPPRELIRCIELKELKRRRQPFLYLHNPRTRKEFAARMLQGHARFVWRDTVNGYPLYEVSWPSTDSYWPHQNITR